MLVTELAQNVTFERQMASNPATPFGIELRHVEDLHRSFPREARSSRAHSRPALRISLQIGVTCSAAHGAAPRAQPPFAALAARHGRPLRVAILSDFTRIPYANGAAFQTRFLYQELRRCGHEVTVIGPHDPDAQPRGARARDGRAARAFR